MKNRNHLKLVIDMPVEPLERLESLDFTPVPLENWPAHRKPKGGPPSTYGRVKATKRIGPATHCLRCDEPAKFRIVTDGIPGASSCDDHRKLLLWLARKDLGYVSPKRRPRKPAPSREITGDALLDADFFVSPGEPTERLEELEIGASYPTLKPMPKKGTPWASK